MKSLSATNIVFELDEIGFGAEELQARTCLELCHQASAT